MCPLWVNALTISYTLQVFNVLWSKGCYKYLRIQNIFYDYFAPLQQNYLEQLFKTLNFCLRALRTLHHEHRKLL